MVVAAAAGIDTWKPCWRPPEDVADAIAAAGARATSRGTVLPEPVAGHRVLWYGGSGLLAAEGHPRQEGLCLPADLPAALRSIEDELAGVLGVELAGFRSGVGRLDATVDLAFEDGAVGIAALAGIAGLDAGAHFRVVAHRAAGERALATVSWHAKRGVQARAYDKGREALSAPVGRLLRLEDQRRWPGPSRRVVDELDADYVRQTWQRRFTPLWRASKGVTVVTQANLVRRVREAVAAGEITHGQAIDVIGHLVAEANGYKPGSRMTRYRHRRLADQLGLQLVGGVLQEVEIDLNEVLEAAMEPAVWDREADYPGD